MPRCASSRARRTSSWWWLLPPSITTSPGARCCANSAMVDSVAAPCGSITHTARGARRQATSSCSPRAGRAPSAANASTAASSRSCTTHS